MMTGSAAASASEPPRPPDLEQTAPSPPHVPTLELERLRREVKGRLFGASQPPVAIDRYQLLGCIGQGGMGIVFAARDVRLGRTVALKLLRPELSHTGAHGHGNLTTEAQSLAKLSHPNVVAVFDVGEHDGQLYVAMEYVEGQSLRRWLELPRSLAAILEVYLAAGEGLAAAHRAGLVHRDFKPDNVLVGADGRPRILDFGLARPPDSDRRAPSPPSFAADTEATATSLSRHGLLLGTPAYMAPEQHLGEPADARSDQYGFCVALYQALYGTLPFPTDDLRALSLAIVSGKLTPPPIRRGVPERLRRALIRGLRVEPDARFPTMDALLGELRDIRASLDLAPAAEDDLLEPAEPVYDTRAIARAFGRPLDEVLDEGRPPLSKEEMTEIAEEVGLELSPPSSSSDAALARRGARAPERTHFGLPSTIVSERQISVLPTLETQRRIVRELERNLGGTGVVEQFEAGMSWANQEAEASIDRNPEGARLTLRRSFAKLARRRRRRGMIFGGFAGLITGAMLSDFMVGILNPLEGVVVFGMLAVGLVTGGKLARKLHGRHMDEERALLDWLGERVEALTVAEADPRRAALAPPSRRDRGQR